MVTITLLTMPIVAVNCPSIGLTQLKDVTRRAHGDRVDLRLLYLQHDFARYMKAGREAGGGGGPDLYDIFCGNQMHNTGLGDWFFRQAAFPELPDNSREYFTRYYPGRAPELERFKAALLERRQGLEAFLDSLIDRYRLAESDIVGFSTMFQQNGATIAMARRLKRARPGLTIVVGGANCEPPMGQELLAGVDCIDYVFSGPALKSLPEFVGRYLEGDEAGLRTIRGVLSRGAPPPADGREAMGEELDIDAEVELGYSDFIESLERAFPGEGQVPVMFFETSRGCWWGERSHCTFCGLNGVTMEYRAMQPDRAVTLIQGLIDRYASKSNYFFCVDNIMPTNYVKEVLPRIRLPSDATIFYEVKANIDEDVVAAMAAAGVRKIQPGIESLATSTLKLMKKGSTAFVNLRLLKACVKHRVRPQWNLLIGFPGEGADVYSKYVSDLDRLSHLCPPDGSFPVRFDRYSPYFVKAQEYGLDLRPLDYYGMTYPFDEGSLSRLAYYFTDVNYSAPYIEAVVQWLGRIREKTSAWLGRWNGGDFASAPRLYLARREGGGVIHDSRNGRVVEHAVDGRRVALLERLELPLTHAALAAEAGPELDADLAWLDERGLVWTEGDRTMSLVLLGEY